MTNYQAAAAIIRLSRQLSNQFSRFAEIHEASLQEETESHLTEIENEIAEAFIKQMNEFSEQIEEMVEAVSHDQL